MKNHSPAFQLYPKEFLSDVNVVDMTDKECGRYIKLLCHCWIEDGLSKDLRVVKGWLNHSPSIARCFYEKDGKFHHKRLDEEREKQRIWAEKSRIGGLHSIEKKRLLKGGYKGGSTKAQPKANTPSASASPSPVKKRDIEYLSRWNEFAKVHHLAEIQGIDRGSKRAKTLHARLKDKSFDFDKLLSAISESPFLLGLKKDFKATFDWVIAPSNYTKIMEGNYRGTTPLDGPREWLKQQEVKDGNG